MHILRGLIPITLVCAWVPTVFAVSPAAQAAIGGIVANTATSPTGRQTRFEATTARRYILYVPTNYDGQRSYPLIISSHGTAQNGDTEMDATGPNSCCDRGTPTWPMLAEDNDIVVACPDMTGAYGSPNNQLASGQLDQLASDDNAIVHILSEIQAMYNINAQRTLITGFSGGGHVAHYVGLRHPNMFEALCARHGNFNVEETPSPLPEGALDIDAYIFTGINDPTYGTNEAISWYTAQGFVNVKTDLLGTYPSTEHTTDRHHALSWFISPPVAVIDSAPAPAAGFVPLTVNFDASGSHDSDSIGGSPQIVSYEWDFTNDGTYDESHAFPTASHEYTVAGTYTCRLRVTDNEGMTDKETITIIPRNMPGDFDGDRDVDQEDFGHFQVCYSGSGQDQNDPNCLGAILDDDGDVDQGDFAVFLSCMSGADNPADPNCAG